MTKLSVYTRDIGLAGIEVYDLLRDEYDIQIELGDICNILSLHFHRRPDPGYRAAGGGAWQISNVSYSKDPAQDVKYREYINPTVLVSPQAAFYAEKKSIPIREIGRKDLRRVCDVLSAGNPDPRAG